MKTRLDIITRALRRLRVVAMDETATAEQEQTTSDALDALYEELPGAYGVFLNGVDEVDDSIFLPLSYLLAAEVAPEFSVTSPETKARALVRLRATTNPNDFASSAESGGYY